MNKDRGGFVKMIVAIVISLVILSLFGVDIEERIKSPLIKKNLDYALDVTKAGFGWAWGKVVGLTK